MVVLTLAVSGVASGYLLRHSGQLMQTGQGTHLRQLASWFADAIGPALAAGDVARVRSLAGRAVNGMPLVFAAVTDADHNAIASAAHSSIDARLFGHREDGPPGLRVFVTPDDASSSFLQATYPISSRHHEPGAGDGVATLLGYVRVGMAADRWQRSMASRVDMLIGVGMIAALVVIPLGFLLVRRIIGPVEALAETMTRFAGGEMSVRSATTRQDEIGRLARTFNQMADQHHKTHQGLVTLNAELEERVASRTRQLREIASREPLTGLYNRRHFNEVLHRRLAEAQRYDTDLSCIMIDLDEFKHANDAFGHQVGDELLVLTAMTIVGQLRTADVAARYGGDEFIILLPQTDAGRASALADRIMRKFNRDTHQRFPDANVTMSAGIGSLHELETPSADGLVRAADQAMYRAKSEGKNRVAASALAPAP